MKNIKHIVLVIISFILLSGCDKDDLQYQNEQIKLKNSIVEGKDYAFINPEWALVNKEHKDTYGNVGKLYVNKNNQIEKKFEINKLVSVPTGGDGNQNWTGTLEHVRHSNLENGQTYEVISCNTREAKDCCFLLEYEGETLKSVELYFAL